MFNDGAAFDVARRLRSPAGARLGDVFSFVSGLYFRGKATYAGAFGRAPQGLSAGLVISPSEGLRFLDEPVTVDRLRAWAKVPIDAGNRRFTDPLVEHAAALERAYGATARFVLLGSVASDKYVRPLVHVFGDHLLFPSDFVGRGDMSRGALLLRAARAGRELGYEPVETAVRHGRRPPSLAARPRKRRSRSAQELVLLVGLPGAGKTTFYRSRFAETHVHVNRDQLRTSRRQQELVALALAAGKSIVVDNTNATITERAALIATAQRSGIRVVGYYFDVTARECIARNANRQGKARVPNAAIFAVAKRMAPPAPEEGFDELHVLNGRFRSGQPGR